MSRKVLITGGSGVNGVWVVRDLLEGGMTPVLYDWQPDLTFLQDVRADLRIIQGDIRDAERLLAVVRDVSPDAIVHMAALMPVQAQTDPRAGFDVNAGGTVNVLEAARRCGVRRVVFTSSKGAYGNITGVYGHPTYEPLSEDYPRGGFTVYDLCKSASEGMGINYMQRYGVEFVALRFSAIFGPGKLARHGPYAVHSRMIENALAGRNTSILHGGDQKDDTTYVKDVAQGIVLAVMTDHIMSPAYNIGTGVGRTLGEMAAAVRKVFPAVRIEVGPGLDYMQTGVQCYSVLDIRRAQAELGYHPQFDLYTGVKDYVEVLDRFGVRPIETS